MNEHVIRCLYKPEAVKCPFIGNNGVCCKIHCKAELQYDETLANMDYEYKFKYSKRITDMLIRMEVESSIDDKLKSINFQELLVKVALETATEEELQIWERIK